MKILTLLGIACVVLSSCNRIETKADYFKIPDAMKEESRKSIAGKLNKNFSVVYYYPGDCSICYGNITTIRQKLPEIPLTVISSSNDTVLIESYLQKIAYNGKVFVDKDRKIIDANNSILSKNKIFLIDSNNKILAASDYVFDDKTFDDFKEKIKSY